jgi:hypothetical protein
MYKSSCGVLSAELYVFAENDGKLSVIQNLKLNNYSDCALVDGDHLYIGCSFTGLYKFKITSDPKQPLTVLSKYKVSSGIIKMRKKDNIVFIC